MKDLSDIACHISPYGLKETFEVRYVEEASLEKDCYGRDYLEVDVRVTLDSDDIIRGELYREEPTSTRDGKYILSLPNPVPITKWTDECKFGSLNAIEVPKHVGDDFFTTAGASPIKELSQQVEQNEFITDIRAAYHQNEDIREAINELAESDSN